PDAGYRHARGFGQVGQPVWAWLYMFPGISEQQPDVPGGLLLALVRVGQGRQERIGPGVAPAGAVIGEGFRPGQRVKGAPGNAGAPAVAGHGAALPWGGPAARPEGMT